MDKVAVAKQLVRIADKLVEGRTKPIRVFLRRYDPPFEVGDAVKLKGLNKIGPLSKDLYVHVKGDRDKLIAGHIRNFPKTDLKLRKKEPHTKWLPGKVTKIGPDKHGSPCMWIALD